ncbi:tetratricopeptide repeat protein [Paraburkholderia bryophila]|uniref:tetratricopeptide repeat protein n=1 Tax=Paraburkholderia bryophila TaxID=420952 RepID=UPI00234BB6D4|nr:tetratricopeptide repeat protein [Paraburkholderia bryophila]WCM22564.1 tetratricopeptide repeat protein [Paraburkholderia bryophila]
MSADNLAQCFQDGLMAHQRMALAEAERAYREVLAANPSHAAALRLLGLIYLERGDFEAAESLLRDSVKADPDVAETHCDLGVVLERSEHFAEAEACYRQAVARKPDFALAYNNLGIVLHKAHKLAEAQACLRHLLTLEPGYAQAHFNLGNVLWGDGRVADAEACYRHALSLEPHYAEAHSNLGLLLAETGRQREAEACYREALALRPDDADGYCNLGALLYTAQRLAEAEVCFRDALNLRSDFVSAYNKLGCLLNDTQRLTEAEACFRRVLEINPAYLPARHNLSLILLKLGRYEEAWPLHESRHLDSPEWGAERMSRRRPDLPFPQWQGETLAGKSLLIWPEQGFGDYIQFARFLPLLKSRGVSMLTVASPPSLRTLLERIDGVDAWTDSDNPVDLPRHDYWCFVMSLPLHLGVTLTNIPARLPYLSAPPERVLYWRQRLPEGIRCGLVWSGEPRPDQPAVNAIDRRRSLHLRAFLPLLGLAGMTFVSLQKGRVAEAQLDEILPHLRPLNPMPEVRDFADTAAIIENLDLVIAVDTSVAHLAGALNKPVWILSRFDGCWRWLLDRDDSPWYPEVARLYRQQQAGDWGPVVERIVQDISRPGTFSSSRE